MTTIQDKINKIVDEQFPIEKFAEAFEMQKLVKNTFGIKCPICGSNNIHKESEMLTRSIDEISKAHFVCIDCGKKFRK